MRPIYWILIIVLAGISIIAEAWAYRLRHQPCQPLTVTMLSDGGAKINITSDCVSTR